MVPGDAVTSSREENVWSPALLLGANLTVTVQLAPGARDVVQVLAVIANAGGPPISGL